MEKLPKYSVYRGKRNSIRLVMRINGTLAVYCPTRCPVREIEETVKKHYDELRQKHNSRTDHLIINENGTDKVLFLGKRYPIEHSDVKRMFFDNGRFVAPLDSDNTREAYLKLLKNAAKEYLPPIIKALGDKHGFTFSSVRIKTSGSRFGSCSSKGNINFSLALMACDEDFIRYVILHELCHTVHMNHSESFHALLEKVYPNHKAVSAEGKRRYSALVRAITYRRCP